MNDEAFALSTYFPQKNFFWQNLSLLTLYDNQIPKKLSSPIFFFFRGVNHEMNVGLHGWGSTPRCTVTSGLELKSTFFLLPTSTSTLDKKSQKTDNFMSAYKWTARLKEVVEAQEPQPHVEEEGGEGVYEDWGDARPVDEAGIPRLCPKVHEYSELAAQCAVEERVETLARIKADIPDADTLWKTLTDASFQMLSKLQAMNTSTSSQDDDGSNPRLPTYGSYRAAALRVAAKAGVPGEKFSISQYLAGEYVTPHLFYLSQRLPDTSSTPSLPIYTHITRKTVLQEMRIMLELCDSGGDGYLSEADFELFIHKIMPNLRTVKHVQQMMQGHYAVFYKCHAARKFFFFLDPSHRGRLSIDTILNSETLFELAKLFQIGNDDDVCYVFDWLPKSHVLWVDVTPPS